MTTTITYHGHPAVFIGLLPPVAGRPRRASIYITCPDGCCHTVRKWQHGFVYEELDRIHVEVAP